MVIGSHMCEFASNLGYSHFCTSPTTGQDGQTFERNSTMPILRYLAISLASALVAAYAVLWYASPAPIEQSHAVTVPPLTVQEHQGDLLIWGSWKTVAGCGEPRHNPGQNRCER